MRLINGLTSVKKKTEGAKTTTATAIWLLLQIINGIKPDAIPGNVQVAIYNVVEILAAAGLIDKAWRYRKEIITKMKSLWKKEKGS